MKGSATTEKKLGHLFKPGEEWKGNKLGRPKGSRNRLSEQFLTAMCADFEKHGQTVIDTVRAEKPADYLKIVASIVPKELTLNTQSLGDMSDEDLLDRLDQVRSLAAALAGATATSRAGTKSRKAKPSAAH